MSVLSMKRSSKHNYLAITFRQCSQTTLSRCIGLTVFLLLLIFQVEANAQFVQTGNMLLPRSGHTATLLQNGKVLIVGGTDEQPASRDPNFLKAEIYDPATGNFTFTGSINVPRSSHTATLLNNGKVLIVGGDSIWSTQNLRKIELYDPSSGTFSVVGALDLARIHHTSTLLPNGNVLIIGGRWMASEAAIEASVLIYNPQTGSLTNGGVIRNPRRGHQATLLQNGKVLIVGGYQRASGGITASVEKGELYDPATRTFSEITSPFPWYWSTLPKSAEGTLLHDGRVLYGPTPGADPRASYQYPSHAVAFDPGINTFSESGDFLSPRKKCDGVTVTHLSNNKVLFTGGHGWGETVTPLYYNEAEVYDPVTDTMSQAGSMGEARVYHTATLMVDGRVLITGGYSTSGPLRNSELYIPSDLSETIPLSPSNLQATAISSSEIVLQWTDNSNNETGFSVEQASVGGQFSELGTVEANRQTVSIIELAAATSYTYRVRAFNLAGYSGYSNTDTATTPGAVATVTRFINNTSYMLVSLIVDGSQYIPNAGNSILPGAYLEIPLSQGQHSYVATNGFWDGANRFEMYQWTQNFSQPSGTTFLINFNDPTIYQLLTQFNSAGTGLWSGTYWDANGSPHTAAFRFTLSGNWTFFDDNQNTGTGTYALVSRDPSSFTVTFTIGAYQGTYYELSSYFVMRNGPPAWPFIDYYYQGP